MAFKVLFIAHAPDADKYEHRSSINTGMYHLYTVVLKNQEEALEISREFVENFSIDCVLLCPGFTNKNVAEISSVVGENVAVAVSRGDGPGNKTTLAARKREGYPPRK